MSEISDADQQYNLVRFGNRSMEPAESAILTNLHTELLAHSPIVLMGPRFMREFYYQSLPRDGLICGAIAYVAGQPAGFIVGTDDADGFMSKAIGKHWIKIVWIMLKSLIANPKRAAAVYEAFDINRNVQAETLGSEVGELLSFGVLPQYRTRKFVVSSGVQVSRDLLSDIVDQLRSTKARRLRAIVDKDNIEAQLFYRSNGWRVGNPSVKGWSVPTMEFLLDLD